MDTSTEKVICEESFADLLRMGSDEFNLLLKQENLLNFKSVSEDNSEETKDGLPRLHRGIPDTTSVCKNIPSPTSILPSFEDYAGPYDFHVEIKVGSDRGKLMFSEALNKIFVKMEHVFPILFKWDQNILGLYIRALLVFVDEEHIAEPVRRCAAHVSAFERSNTGFPHVNHVIRCQHAHCMYVRDPKTERFSVLVPLDCPQPGADGTRILFMFMCKNSCLIGINRRSTGIIFTLERENGEVVGRRMIKIRICSCPRRDLEKEESFKEISEESVKGTGEESVKEIGNENQIGNVRTKKPLKRLWKNNRMINFQVRLPKAMQRFVATMIKEAIGLKPDAELSVVEKATLEDCEKYLDSEI